MDAPGVDAGREWSDVLCLGFGHDWVGHTTYKLTGDSSVAALYGDLCARCGKFRPRSDGKERYENAEAAVGKN